MASSFADQIPAIVHIVDSLKPKRVLDLGKGFGKYGFLLHEYYGVDHLRAPDPEQMLKNQSRLQIDAVDINRDYSFPHLEHFYDRVLIRDITKQYDDLVGYDFVLMCDIIEHLDKTMALRILRHFLDQNATILVSTPRVFFQQELYESEAERHVSHWTARDFRGLGASLLSQNVGPGRIFLLSPSQLTIRGFGDSLLYRLRRVARVLMTEFG